MKAIAVSVLLLALIGCTSRTEFGECTGLDGDKDPALVYRISKWNLVVGLICLGSIVVPVVVALEQAYCPVARRDAK